MQSRCMVRYRSAAPKPSYRQEWEGCGHKPFGEVLARGLVPRGVRWLLRVRRCRSAEFRVVESA
ncbi:uncharacterized protein EKO05_0010416 [Ascochyta rabiei]|uniref:uncharacterized protein n=1 Tax=Didymella rabiei TaxID=5454 RepID=UPI0021FEF987|nr:uncharacterized protein EKO05_0010416 [Ascochyta rabiei]UPX20175.1 hypothetical protein EKO05_0010416 [Ascochyta rabiei]